jgi:hypothetical protein
MCGICADHKHCFDDVIKSNHITVRNGNRKGNKLHFSKVVNWIINKHGSISEYLASGRRVATYAAGYDLLTLPYFHDWQRLTNDEKYAREIAIEAEKLDSTTFTNEFKTMLQACYETLSKVDLPSGPIEEITAIPSTKVRELVVA